MDAARDKVGRFGPAKIAALAVAGAGALAAVAGGVLLAKRRRANADRPAAALADHRPPGFIGDSGVARDAGPAEMRDPPSRWNGVDEASDESFPASDPPAIGPPTS